jgi:transcriptional regulator with XRE-family HTH domain
MPYLNRLSDLKKEKKMTNTEIARLANLPLATVTRIFNGSTPNPTFETFVHIAIALGASLDEIAGLKQSETPPIDAPIENTLTAYSDLLKEKDDRICELKAERDKEKREKHRLFLVLFAVTIVSAVILTIDVLNGNFGYFRY